MFATNLLDRRSKPERVAEHAWRHLLTAVNSAGDSVLDTARSGAIDIRLRRAGISIHTYRQEHRRFWHSKF